MLRLVLQQALPRFQVVQVALMVRQVLLEGLLLAAVGAVVLAALMVASTLWHGLRALLLARQLGQWLAHWLEWTQASCCCRPVALEMGL